MSRFFRSADSSSSSEDDGEEEIDSPATNSPNKQASSSRADKSDFETPSQDSALSPVSNNHAEAVLRDKSSQQWTSHHKDVLLHALLEYWSMNETVGGHQRVTSPNDPVEAQARYQRLASQLATLNVLPENLGQDQHASTRQGYREALGVLGRQPSDVAVPSRARRLLTDGSGDAVPPLYAGVLEPFSEGSRDKLALQAPLRRLLGHTAQQGGCMPARSDIASLPLGGLMQHGGMTSEYGQSRYRSDFEELSVLGKGGYGIVYHARNRLDNQAYAVKKVPLSAARLYRIRNRGQTEVDDILMELRTLARLHHPNIVRYHNAWVDWTEATTSEATASGRESYGATGTQDALPGAESSHAGHLRRIVADGEIDGNDIVFEHSGAGATTLPESESMETTSLEHSDEPGQLRRTRTRSTLATVSDETVESIDRKPEVSVSIQSTAEGAQFAQPTLAIHIQMSLHPMTLADLLSSKAEDKDCLQHCYHLQPSVGIATTVLEGLEYLHQEGVVHRDIKPANIFLTPSKSRGPRSDCVDLRKCDDCYHPNDVSAVELEVCIGDFGLAAVASVETDRHAPGSPVGTAIYRPSTSEERSVNLDIYALGILFFELVWRLETKMERHHILHELKEGRFPDGFCEWVGRGRGVSVMECIDCMLAQDSKSLTFPELREKLGALVAPMTT